MIVLIDGYNLLKKIYGIDVKDTEIRAFAHALSLYGRKKNHHLKLILDGGTSGFITKELLHGIEIWYSGYKRSADEVIVEYVERNKGKEFLVVTEDNGICKKVILCGASVISPFVFYEKMKEVIYEIGNQKLPLKEDFPKKIKKITEEDDELIDNIMHEAALMETLIQKKDEDALKERCIKSTLSKKEKRIKKILKKL